MLMKTVVAAGLAAALMSTTAAPTADIVETAIAGHFDTLVSALKAADLVDTLKGAGPFTVFAPTDEAFAKLPAGMLDGLLKPENKAKLQGLLKYHVVAGSVMAAKVTTLKSAMTLEGHNVTIKTVTGAVKITDVTVTKTDIAASNGVIHAIDTVLQPASMKTSR